MPVKIVDIAKAASVSPSAVSLALNNKSGISPEVRKKILDLAADMGYRTRLPPIENENITIKLLLMRDEILVGVHYNALLTGYMEGMEAETKKRRYKLEVSFLERAVLKEFIEAKEKPEERPEGKADGFVVIGSELSDNEISYLINLPQPVVFFDTFFPLVNFDLIDMDNTDGVYRCIEYLYRMGHRNIGLVKGNYETSNFRMRKMAFFEAMGYFSLPVQEKNIVTVNHAIDKTVIDMKRFLDKKSELPSAFFCLNDILAYGCMKALREKGLRIPDDISIVGFDDLPYSAITDPPLTTIKNPSRKIGARAVELLAEKLTRPTISVPEKILVSVELVIRDSVKKCEVLA
jgi:LacI family transcriptional regulator